MGSEIKSIVDNTLTSCHSILTALSGSRFTSFLLQVFMSRSKEITPGRLLREWETNRFFTLPAEDIATQQRIDGIFAESAFACGFTQLELPPVCPFGTMQALGAVHQNNVMSAVRGCEVVSDSTNVLALEAAVRRRNLLARHEEHELVRLSAAHRLLRTQKFDIPRAFAHFRVFSMVTAGRDRGNGAFESELLIHCQSYLNALRHVVNTPLLLTVFIADDYLRASFEERIQSLNVETEIQSRRPSGNGYYQGISFNIDLLTDRERILLVDGGMVDWTAKLLSDAKERLFISGIGTTRLAQLCGVENP